MKFPNPYFVSELAKYLGCVWKGNDHEVSGINEIHVIEHEELVFVDHPKYYKKALNSKASCILINQEEVEIPVGKAIIISENPFTDFNRIGEKFKPFQTSSSLVHPGTEIGENSIVMQGVAIGPEVTIGKNSVIHANVSIQGYTKIGDHVIIQSGTVIGSDAFYYKNRKTHFERLKSTGRVIIENRVEIGANCTIDRGVSGDTIIGEGTVLDNLIQIGHDTKIGKRCLFASQVGIAGCVIIEDEVTLWGQVGVISDIVIGKGAVVYAQSGVGNSLEGNSTYFGSPAGEARTKYREMSAIKSLPEALKKLS